MMKKETYSAYCEILKDELIPALGCTEPIAIAYASALSSSLLEEDPERIDIFVSPNIIKNVKSVIVPNTNGEKGIDTAVAAGIVSSRSDKALEILNYLKEEDIKKIKDFKKKTKINIKQSPKPYVFSIIVNSFGKNHNSSVEIAGFHTNVIKIQKDGAVIKNLEYSEKGNEKKNHDCLNIKDIVEFASIVSLEDVREIIERQIDYNMKIANEGLTGKWGASIGKILLSSCGKDIHNKARSYAAAAADARMNGSRLPVIINSGSGNQGITVSVPVICFAEEEKKSREELIRALVVSNLVAIHLKTGIGSLSAYCGATSAASASSAGIMYLNGGREKEVSHVVVNSLAIASGMICDGAKASCAAKIASAVGAALIGYEMYRNNKEFYGGDGIVEKGVENTINNVGKLASVGMRETDKTIIEIMTKDCYI